MTIDTVTIKDPTKLVENYEYIRNDNIALNGAMQRNQLNKKKVATLTWENLYPSELQSILAWADDLNTHAYSNPNTKYASTWAFTGLCTIMSDGQYVGGGSYMTDSFSVKIREV